MLDEIIDMVNREFNKPIDRTYKCVLCGETYKGYGNNPRPLVSDGRCCDKCNQDKVIPYRMML